MTEEKAQAVAVLVEFAREAHQHTRLATGEYVGTWAMPPDHISEWDDFLDVLDAIATLLGPSEREKELSARLEHWQDAYRYEDER